ncbi:MAG: hypothetical protein CMLOHMNK_02330 [Steroidobacteraceae bacterium]|nr:hypothetical protein [Steroidobacteraceae bacterium]
MAVERINPESLFSYPPLSHVVISPPGKLAFIAGQTALDREFRIVGGASLHAQALAAFANLRAALAAAGARPEDVVSSNVYIVGLNQIRANEFASAMQVACDGQPFPPHAFNLIGVASLGSGEALIEISAVAALP